MPLLFDKNASKKMLELKKANNLIVFTNGCFDIIHKGHINYLNQSKALGDYLIVGLNSDDSVTSLKGPKRPINNEKIRATNLLGLDSVDFVVVFEGATPRSLIKSILPDILTKGGDYKENEIVGYNTVTLNGGKIKILPFLEGYSTTSILRQRSKSLD